MTSNNQTPSILDIAKDNTEQKKYGIFALVLGIVLSLGVVGVFIWSQFVGLSDVLYLIFNGLNELLLALLTNPIAWAMATMLIVVLLVFVALLPKRERAERKPMSTARIAEVGVVTAAVAVVYLTTAWLIDALIPYIGCVARTILVAVYLSGVRHYKLWELFLITTMSLVITLIILPCPINAIAIPISIAFVLVYGALRRHTPPWLAVTIGTAAAYLMMIASIGIYSPDQFWDYVKTAFSFSWVLLIVIPLIAWWRQRKQADVPCHGCDLTCDSDSVTIGKDF